MPFRLRQLPSGSGSHVRKAACIGHFVRQVKATPRQVGYSGEYQDRESGLICCGQRYRQSRRSRASRGGDGYSPTQGRFITRDPIGDLSGQTNHYAFVNNDPINSRDILGLTEGSEEAGNYGNVEWFDDGVVDLEPFEFTCGFLCSLRSGNGLPPDPPFKSINEFKLQQTLNELGSGSLFDSEASARGFLEASTGGSKRSQAKVDENEDSEKKNELPPCSELKGRFESGEYNPTLTAEAFIPDAEVSVPPLGLFGFETFHGDGRGFLDSPSDGSPGRTSRISASVTFDSSTFSPTPSFRVDPSTRTRFFGATSVMEEGTLSSISAHNVFIRGGAAISLRFSGSNPLAPAVLLLIWPEKSGHGILLTRGSNHEETTLHCRV